MIQIINMQNVKIEVNEFEQMQPIVHDLIFDGFNVSATIHDANWLIVAEKERVQGQLTAARAGTSSGVYFGAQQDETGS